MATRSLTTWPGLVRSFLSYGRLALRLLREPNVPIWTKALPIAAAVYLVSPLDVIPDVLPLVGQIDDAAIALIALRLFVYLCPLPAVTFHRDAIAQGRPFSPMPLDGKVIDAEWRREVQSGSLEIASFQATISVSNSELVV